VAPRLSLTLRPVTSPGHSSPILCASFSPTGNLLATGSGDTNARLWDLFTETPSHTLTGHRGWVLCVEWEALERKLATGGHDGHVSNVLHFRHTRQRNSPSVRVGPDMGSQDRKAYRRCAKRTHKMDYVSVLGTSAHVGRHCISSFPRGLKLFQKPFLAEIGVVLKRWYR
jgi:WD40 repeat protein